MINTMKEGGFMLKNGYYVCRSCGYLFDSFIPYMQHVGFAGPDSEHGCLPEEVLRGRGMYLVDGVWSEPPSDYIWDGEPDGVL